MKKLSLAETFTISLLLSFLRNLMSAKFFKIGHMQKFMCAKFFKISKFTKIFVREL